MQTSRRIFAVFLASPSDVKKEREISANVVANVNRSVANRLGWHIDLHRWEETPPSFGRPQDSINPLLDQCDLFIGLLWRWWGQPTGAHSSGFEEEFERAKARRKTGGVPEIWLMSLGIGRSGAKDPGGQLKKVIEFRELQTRLNEVKYANVKNADDWGSKLQSWLSQYVLELASNHPEHL